ncbi:MAG: polymorphic toxin type 44 domain-containing protein [Oscillospiraceae bacterium]|nr:polymorphic toxin type 44 domain-containing protein [Oscillospiraceae bacterium]WMJ83369.1 polymorphic toxin type 44 domain-containing protein [Oscillospiraceae bacterium MB24-C1]
MEDAIVIAFRDRYGYVVGTEDYFSALNKGILSGLMADDRKYNYREALRKSADRIHHILDEIDADLLFGYVGKLFGYHDEFLSAGAGAYQIKEGTWDWSFWPTYFDDPYDNKMIRKGIEYYNKTH